MQSEALQLIHIELRSIGLISNNRVAIEDCPRLFEIELQQASLADSSICLKLHIWLRQIAISSKLAGGASQLAWAKGEASPGPLRGPGGGKLKN